MRLMYRGLEFSEVGVNMEKRKIRIKCNFAKEICNMFNNWLAQLSDGYWENSRGEFGSYGDGWYESVWNCFEFGTEKISSACYSRSNFVITLKGNPTWSEAKGDCEKFHELTDESIVDYLVEALFASIEEAPLGIFGINEYELNVLEDCISEWEILPPPKPKLSHKELEKLVGYEFDYVE